MLIRFGTRFLAAGDHHDIAVRAACSSIKNIV
jgi:hypothetical protein